MAISDRLWEWAEGTLELWNLFASANWGSIADWVSGAGSIGAAITALYLAGSERRARTLAERPHIKVELPDSATDGWLSVQLTIENRASLHWRMTGIQAVWPRNAKVVLSADTYRKNEDAPWDGPIFDEDLREKNLARKIGCRVVVHSAGTPGGASNNHQPRDIARETFLVHLPSKARKLKLKLHFSSLEPISNEFCQSIVRKLN